MKVVENVTIYKCDFCKKEMKRKHAMEKHESECNCNPINLRPCLDFCQFLERRPVILGTGKLDYLTGEESTREYTGFYCSLKQQYLIHPKAVYKNPHIKGEVVYNENDEEITQEFMPKECTDYKHSFEF